MDNSVKGKTVLLVDDYQAAAEILKTQLEKLGAIVMTATRVDRAVTLVAGGVDAVILEPRLPQCFGIEALRQIHKASKTPVPVLITSWGFDRVAIQTMAMYGAVAYLSKPIFVSEIVSFLGAALHELSQTEKVRTAA